MKLLSAILASLALVACGGGAFDVSITDSDEILNALKCQMGYSYDAARDVCIARPSIPAASAPV